MARKIHCFLKSPIGTHSDAAAPSCNLNHNDRDMTESSALPRSCLSLLQTFTPFIGDERYCCFPRGAPLVFRLHTDVHTLSVQCHNPSARLLCPIWQPVSGLLLAFHLSDSVYLRHRSRTWRGGWAKATKAGWFDLGFDWLWKEKEH